MNLKSDLAEMKGRFTKLLQLVQRPMTAEEDCYRFAYAQFQRFFVKMINRLLELNPLDSLNKDGSPFWSADKRPPKPL